MFFNQVQCHRRSPKRLLSCQRANRQPVAQYLSFSVPINHTSLLVSSPDSKRPTTSIYIIHPLYRSLHFFFHWKINQIKWVRNYKIISSNNKQIISFLFVASVVYFFRISPLALFMLTINTHCVWNVSNGFAFMCTYLLCDMGWNINWHYFFPTYRC